MTPTDPSGPVPVTVEQPDWHNAETCIENMQVAYDDALEADLFDDGNPVPTDTVVNAGDLGVLIGLAQFAVAHRLSSGSDVVTVPGALRDVAGERQRQVEVLGWTPDHDDTHDCDQALSRAAACYALAGTGSNGPFWITHLLVPQQVWPYRWEWKPKDRRRNLVRAAALLVAEIERLDRATAPTPTGEGA